jgi:hypothetical protein|tara:strand:- start:506 stop:907 length:402 start_codon:yes stop_codon:yes gene_type:complete
MDNSDTESNSSSAPQIDNSELEEFKGKIKNWLSIDNQIRDLKHKIKVLQSNKTEITPQIMEFMNKNKIHNMNLGEDNGKLKYVERETNSTLTQKLIKEKLTEFLKNEEQANNALEFILESREKKSEIKLQRLL